MSTFSISLFWYIFSCVLSSVLINAYAYGFGYMHPTLGINGEIKSNRMSTKLHLRRTRLKTYASEKIERISYPINDQITAPFVRLYVPNEEEFGADKMVGIVQLAKAQKEADDRKMDLILLNDKIDPPICRIADYDKFRYLAQKKQKESLKRQTKLDLKEITMSPQIDEHDFDVRQRAARKFLMEGSQVQVAVKFRGRQMQHTQIGTDLLSRFFRGLQDIAIVHAPPKMDSRTMVFTMIPKKKPIKSDTPQKPAVPPISPKM